MRSIAIITVAAMSLLEVSSVNDPSWRFAPSRPPSVRLRRSGREAPRDPGARSRFTSTNPVHLCSIERTKPTIRLMICVGVFGSNFRMVSAFLSLGGARKTCISPKTRKSPTGAVRTTNSKVTMGACLTVRTRPAAMPGPTHAGALERSGGLEVLSSRPRILPRWDIGPKILSNR